MTDKIINLMEQQSLEKNEQGKKMNEAKDEYE